MKDELKAQTKAQLFGRIPQYSNLRLLWKDRSPRMLAAGLLGGAAALAAYPFLTGDGSAVNSMVCVALFLSIGGQIARQRGLLITLLNLLLAKKALRTVNRGFIDRIFAGFAVGMAAAVPVSCTKNLEAAFVWPLLAWGLPILLAAAGGVLPPAALAEGGESEEGCHQRRGGAGLMKKKLIRRALALAGAASLCLLCASSAFAADFDGPLREIRLSAEDGNGYYSFRIGETEGDWKNSILLKEGESLDFVCESTYTEIGRAHV